jgi:DNA-binding beta-propeller fold protein YncE
VRRMTARYRFAGILAASAALVSVAPAGSAAPMVSARNPASFVAALSVTGHPARQGLAVFSSADGRLRRWLVRRRRSPQPVAVSPDGRQVYFYDLVPAVACPRNGFTEPVLWRVSVRGGRPRRAGVDTTSIAFSPDGRMVARTTTRPCGHTVWIVIRDRRTGTTRRIFLARNPATSNNPVFSARLSWAPDDRHLAVGVSPAAAINSIAVIDALRATAITSAPPVGPCAGRSDECLNPSFDVRGRLTFLKWRNEITPPPERIMRWHGGRAVTLLRLSSNQSADFTASIAVDRTGHAILLEGGLRQREIWRWSAGSVRLLLRSRQTVVTSPVWLGRG